MMDTFLRTPIAVILAVVLLSACGGGGKQGMTQQSSPAASGSGTEAYFSYLSAETPQIRNVAANLAISEANSVDVTGTLLNLLGVAGALAAASRLARKAPMRGTAGGEAPHCDQTSRR